MLIENVGLVLCDIDDTITRFKENRGTASYLDAIFSTFAEHHAAASGRSMEEARREVDAYAEEIIWWDYPDFIAEFNLSKERVWADLDRIHSEHLEPFADAVDLIKRVHAAGVPLCVISNNPLTGCVMKLRVANLADSIGSRYFLRYFGTNICRGMKNQTGMWKRALAALGGADPGDVLTIGDNFKEDFEIPRSVGVGRSLIIDRDSDISERTVEGALVVNDLRNVDVRK